MRIFAIGDLHLSFNDNKPLDIFGDNWKDHYKKIKNNWNEKINDEDVVLLPGDFSWAIDLDGAVKDFEYLDSLPGKKIMINGNHDYWWTSKKKMENYLEEHGFKNIFFLKNNAVQIEKLVVVGTRGWSFTDTENGEKMHSRELIRLENSITYAYENFDMNDKVVICMMHYPPITKSMIENGEKNPYLELLNKYNIKNCIYGHLHGKAHEEACEGKIQNVNLKLVSSDYLNFNPIQLDIL